MKELKERLKVHLKENKTVEITFDQIRSLYTNIYPGSLLDKILSNFIKVLTERDELEIKNTKKQVYIFKPSFFTNNEVNKQLRRNLIRFVF